MDLETSIVPRYQGEARLQRLLWIALHAASTDIPDSRALSQTALKLAHDYAVAEGNVRRYKEIFHLLTQQPQLGTADDNMTMNPQWITERTSQNQQARDVLLQRLGAAKAHLNKEAIRVAYLALAEHDQATGELNDAFHSVLSAKDYCTSRQQTAQVSLQILQAAIHLQNYKTVQEYTTKLSHTVLSAPTPSTDTAVRYKVLVASGLERLAARNYAAAAQKFSEALYAVSGVASSTDESAASGAAADSSSTEGRAIVWSSVLAPDDVALYAAFLSLAMVDSREDLIALAEHPEALELVPQAREALSQFSRRANYQQAWSILQEHLFPILKLDLYMALHFDVLQQKIREKSLIQYWRAYQRVEMSTMAAQMGPGILPPDRVEEILTDLIQRPNNDGFPKDTRMDLSSMTLVRLSTENERLQQTQSKLNRVTHRVLDDTYSMMIRLACLEHDLSVTDPHARKRRGGRGTFGGGVGPAFAGGGGSTEVVLMDSDGEEDDDDMPMDEAGMTDEIDEMNPEDLY